MNSLEIIWMRPQYSYMDMVPAKTVDDKGEKSIKVRTTKSEKCRVTAALACTATGIMLPPMIIFKGTTNRSIRTIKSPMYAIKRRHGWMNN